MIYKYLKIYNMSYKNNCNIDIYYCLNMYRRNKSNNCYIICHYKSYNYCCIININHFIKNNLFHIINIHFHYIIDNYFNMVNIFTQINNIYQDIFLHKIIILNIINFSMISNYIDFHHMLCIIYHIKNKHLMIIYSLYNHCSYMMINKYYFSILNFHHIFDKTMNFYITNKIINKININYFIDILYLDMINICL